MFEKLKARFGFSEDHDGARLDIEERGKQQMNFMKFIIAVLVVAIGLMGLAMTNISHERTITVEIPSTIYAEPMIKVGNGWSNDFYMKVWADWFINKTANFTPGDVKSKFGEAIRFFEQDKVADYVGQFGALSNLVIRNQLRQTFTIKGEPKVTYYDDPDFQTPSSEEEHIRSAVFEYSGVVTQSLSNSVIPDHDCKYTISIKFQGGHLYGNSYDTNCFK
jgi:hypothetical protein